LRRLPLLLICLLLPLSFLYGQIEYATINGQVRDSSSAVVPKVEIQVTNVETNVVYKTQSNAEGLYSIPNLTSGSYKLVAKLTGFKTTERTGIVLMVGDRVGLDLVMQVGTQTETVTVTGEMPMLRTDDTTMGTVLDSRSIQMLPQYNRNALALAHMAPNVNGTTAQGGYSGDFRINGGRTAQAEYILDGTATTTGYQHDVPVAMPSMEAVGEFKVLTNGFSAEYGRLSGGLVTMVTRGGTNQYHGAAYEFFRNDHLNANSFDNNRNGYKKSAFHDNVFGFRFGGPASIPKLYDGRDKTFFFLNYEGVRSVSANAATISSTLSVLERNGDFSQSLANGKAIQIYDPTTGVMGTNSVVTRLPFANNIIPSSRMNAIAKKYIEYYPQPNRAANAGSSHDQNFVGLKTSPSTNNRWTGRVDRNWNSAHISQFSLTQGDSTSGANPWFSPLQRYQKKDNYSWTASFGHTWTVSPTLLFNIRAGYVRNYVSSDYYIDADTSSWGFSQQALMIMGSGVNRAPRIDANDTVELLGGGQSSRYFDTSYSGSYSLQKLMGRHTIKAGYEHRRYYSNTPSGGALSYSVDKTGTSKISPADSTGSGLATMMLGILTGGGGTGYAGPAALQAYHGAYFQDDFKVTSKFTLNLGVRWDYEAPVHERFNRVAMWDADYKWNLGPASGWSWSSVESAVGVSLAQPAWISRGLYGRLAIGNTPEYSGRSMMTTRPYQFGPRAGFAWQFVPKMVMRGGYGINYLTNTGNTMLDFASQNYGYGASGTVTSTGSLDGGLTYFTSLANPFPDGAGYTAWKNQTTTEFNTAILGGGLAPQVKDWRAGLEHVVNFSIQREFGSGANAWVVEIAYNGNFGRNLAVPSWGWHIMEDAYNKLGPLGDKLKTMVPNPFYGVLPSNKERGAKTVRLGSLYTTSPIWGDIWTYGQPMGLANYNSAYLQVDHRFGHGLTFHGAYTIGKLLNDVGTFDGQQGQGRQVDSIPQAGLPLSDVYGEANSDIPHKLVLNFAYDLPVGRGKALLGSPNSFASKLLDTAIGGWQFAGTSIIRNGTPINITLARAKPTNAIGNWWAVNQGKGTRGVFVAGQQLLTGTDPRKAIYGTEGFQYYFNPKAVRLPTGMEIGDVPTTCSYLRNPGSINLDLALMKDFRLYERVKLQLRAEAANALNHMNVGSPGNSQDSSNFGYITSNGGGRAIMVAAKLMF